MLPQIIQFKKRFSNQDDIESINKLIHTAEGRYDVDAKNTPGDRNKKTAALADTDSPTVRCSVEINLVSAIAAQVPSKALII